MPDNSPLPFITTLFDCPVDNPNNRLYQETLCNTLKKILPDCVRRPAFHDPDLMEDQYREFSSLLPLLTSTPCDKTPANISFFLLSKYRPNAFKFFFEMITHWLIPGNRLNVVLLYALDFLMPDYSQDVYTLCEVMVRVDSPAELEELQRNLPIIDSEVRLGVQSSYYARRILEVKGLVADEKTALIQEHIAYLLKRLPRVFDYDILTEMQHVLVMCRDEFKSARDCRHLSRIISVHYLFRKELRDAVKSTPEKRHLYLKLFKAAIHLTDRNKPVVGVLVGLNFLRDKEVFEERHLLGAIANYIPTAQAVEHSFFSNRRGTENICTLYLEIEKNNGEEFTGDEIRMLRNELPADLKDRIEHLLHPVFMPRNEEEIMRNILSLSNQIKYLHDLPQVIISFDEQTHVDLFFTVIMVRVIKPGSKPINEMFQDANTTLGYIHDRTKTLGFMRKKYAKEASVFGVKLPKNQFLRRDHTIDLNTARQTVVTELVKVLGDLRDFNGGMISKQHELLCAVRSLLDKDGKYSQLLLENFFYSLTPDVMRTVMDPKVLRRLFLLLLESIEKGFFSGENYDLKIEVDSHHVFVMVKTEERSIKEVISRALNKLELHSSKLVSSFVLVYEIAYLGYLYICDEPEQQQKFCQVLQQSIIGWDQRKRSPQKKQQLVPN